jgi:uncharacterized membrane-anchored protein YitT (DUF2179 family)
MKKATLKKMGTLTYDYFFICLGLAIFAFGWTAFLTPNQMTGGGVTGLAAIIYFAVHAIPMGITILAINAILIAVAWRVLGPKFCINTLMCTLILSFFMSIGQQFFAQPLVEDLSMCAMIGGALSAFGVGIAISFGGNTGGTDIIALMIGKYRNISYGRVSLYSNILVVASSYLIVQSVEKLVYSMAVMFVYIFISDIVIDGYKQTFQFMVFSKKNQEIADKVMLEIGRGATFLKGYGSYSKEDSDILLIIAHRNDKARIMRVIKEIDNTAFISIAKTSSVFGKNFDNIKI